MREFWNFGFFGQGDVSPNHPEICRFISGLWAKHQVSSPVIILLNFFLHCYNILARCDSIFLLLRCQELWNKMCTQLSVSHILFQNAKNYSLGDVQRFCCHSWCDSTVILAKWATAAMFTSVRLDLWRPSILSLFTSSLPSRSREHHLNTFDRFRSSFP
jgi:hypothetical protein